MTIQHTAEIFITGLHIEATFDTETKQIGVRSLQYASFTIRGRYSRCMFREKDLLKLYLETAFSEHFD